MNAIPGAPRTDRGDLGRSLRQSRYRCRSVLPSAIRHGDAAEGVARIEPRFLPVGDTGISVQFGTEIALSLNEAVARLDHAIAASDLPGVIETVPSFRSLLVIFEPALVDRKALLGKLQTLCAATTRVGRPPGRLWSLPVTYEPPFGEDLAEVSGILGMSERDVVAAHTAAEFRVYMLGFQPGLPNLGGLPPELQVSRRASPRKPVPGGSVMIGGVQGAIMPLPTPSGFYMLGRTPVRLFDRRRQNPALLRAGDTIRFRQACAEEFASIEAAVASGNLNAGVALHGDLV